MAELSGALAHMWHRLTATAASRQLRWIRPAYRHPVSRWLVLQSGPNPSTDYYVRPRAAALGIPTQYRDIERDTPTEADFADGTLVVVVRYLNRRWADVLRGHAPKLAGVVYFMDDDLLDPSAWRGLPARYRDKLAKHFAAVAVDIAAMASQVWVSTPELQARYHELQPEVTPPLPLVDDGPRQRCERDFVRIFYHGTQAHEAEIRWLRPVVAACLDACPQAHFEIIGDLAVNRLYRDLPRTRVLHPMSWLNYLAHCRSMQGDIGLVPLLESGFNAGRSHTKVLDVTRCGGVGVYSCTAPYETVVRDGVDGLLLPNDKPSWVKHIMALVRDNVLLSQLHRRAAERFISANCDESAFLARCGSDGRRHVERSAQ